MNEVSLKTELWSNGQKHRETSYVNGQRHGVATWWHDNGQKMVETPYVNGQRHGVAKWWRSDGNLNGISKWHRDERLVRFIFEEDIPFDARLEVDLFSNEIIIT